EKFQVNDEAALPPHGISPVPREVRLRQLDRQPPQDGLRRVRVFGVQQLYAQTVRLSHGDLWHVPVHPGCGRSWPHRDGRARTPQSEALERGDKAELPR